MPLPIAHSLAGASLVALLHPPLKKTRLWMPLALGAFLANAADLDFVLVFWFGSKEWHRSFTHSILFSIFVFLLIWAINKFSRIKETAAFGLAYASHLVLDFIATKNGGGPELFWFLTNERFGLHWFGLSESPSKLNFWELLGAIFLELIIFAPILFLSLYFRKIRREE